MYMTAIFHCLAPRAVFITLATIPWALAAELLPGGFDCILEPAQVVEIRSPVVGLIQTVHTRRGEIIRQGQVLVSIESSVERSAAETARYRSQAQGALQLARNKVSALREKAQRMERLQRESFVSTQARDDAATELRLAEAELKSAEEAAQLARLEHRQSVDQINRRILRAPFSGVVVDQYLFPGASVDASEGKKPILKIAQTNPLLAQAILPYRLFPQLRIGMPAIVIPEKPFERHIAATIRTVDRVVDAAAGTFGVVAQVDNAKQSLPGGIRCKLKIDDLKVEKNSASPLGLAPTPNKPSSDQQRDPIQRRRRQTSSPSPKLVSNTLAGSGTCGTTTSKV